MLIDIGLIAIGLVMLFVGGDALVRGASVLAAHLGVSTLTIGLTVVAFGTSAPELVVSVDAVLSGANDIAISNVVGSNIANIALILGIAAIVCPLTVEAKLIRFDAPVMLAAAIALLLLLVDGTASRLEGALLLVGLVAYTAFTFWEARRETNLVRNEFASAAPTMPDSVLLGTGLVALGLALLVGGGHLLVVSAVDIARYLGVPQATIGLTVVAIGTSLPEFATSVVAAARGRGDVAVGNIVGSNIFNVLGILGITAVIRPLQIGTITWIDLFLMTGLAVVTMLLLLLRGRLARIEGSLLLSTFVIYMAWLLTP